MLAFESGTALDRTSPSSSGSFWLYPFLSLSLSLSLIGHVFNQDACSPIVQAAQRLRVACSFSMPHFRWLWHAGAIYTASHDAQGSSRGVHFGDRARGAKIGPSEEAEEGGEGREVGRVSESGSRKREQRFLQWRLSGRLARWSLKNG
jgi:hypothetical protein